MSYLVVDSERGDLHCERDEEDGSVQKIRSEIGIEVDLLVHNLRVLDCFGSDIGKCTDVHRTLPKNRKEKVQVENVRKWPLLRKLIERLQNTKVSTLLRNAKELRSTHSRLGNRKEANGEQDTGDRRLPISLLYPGKV